MITNQFQNKLRQIIKFLQSYTDRLWYAPFISFLAALDNLIIIIPTDGLVISSSMLKPKRWFIFALTVAIGSTLGAMFLSTLVEQQGLPWILDLYPGINHSKTWTLSMNFFENYGLWLVFAVAITPVMQQPAVILASLANTPVLQLAVVIFLGRFIKFLIMAYISSHTPHLIQKMWGVKSELEDVGVKS